MKIKVLAFLSVLGLCTPLLASDTDEKKEASIPISISSPVSPSLVLQTSIDGEEDSDLEAQKNTRTTAASSTKKRKQKNKNPLGRGVLGEDDEDEIEDRIYGSGYHHGMRVAPNLRGMPLRLDGDDLQDDPTILPMRDIQARETLLKRLQEQDARRWTFGIGFYSNLATFCGVSGEVLKGVATTFGGVALAVGSQQDKNWFNYAVVLCGTFGQSFLIWSEKADSAAKQRRYDIEKLTGYQVKTLKLKNTLLQQTGHPGLLRMGAVHRPLFGVDEGVMGNLPQGQSSFIPVDDPTIIPMDPAAGQAILDNMQQQDGNRWLWSEAFYGWSASILGTLGNGLSGVSTALAGAALFTGDEETKQWYSFGVVISGATGSLCSFLSAKARAAEKQCRVDVEKMAGVEASLPTQPTAATDNAGAL
ncbi:MAG: hypothetical protein H2057_02085 [Alphaproteobacteria bacterium]|nr:hypothetical protein [Alphaproteobacteria bacterium]